MLLNLPSSGIIDSDGFTWNKRPRVIGRGRTDASTQVLKPVDPTEALVASMKSASGKKVRNVSQKNEKRPREDDQGAAASGHASKRPQPSQPVIKTATAAGPSAQQPTSSSQGAFPPLQSSAPPPTSTKTSTLPDRKAIFSLEDLKSRNLKQLQEILRSKSLTLSGTKDQIIQRIVDHQRRQKLAQQGHVHGR